MKILMRAIPSVFFILLTLLLSGCGSGALLLDKSTPLVKPGLGLVYCSFYYKEPSENADKAIYLVTSVKLAVRPVGGKDVILDLNTDTAFGGGGWRDSNIATMEDGKASVVSAVSLPVGEYEVVSREVYIALPVSSYSKSLPLAQPFRFFVKANEATYLGANKIVHEFGKNVFGHTVPNLIRISTTDQFDADLKMLIKARPEAASLLTSNALLQSQNSSR